MLISELKTSLYGADVLGRKLRRVGVSERVQTVLKREGVVGVQALAHVAVSARTRKGVASSLCVCLVPIMGS